MRPSTRTLRGVVVAAAVVLLGCATMPAMEEETESKKEEIRQIAIMAKVLETQLKEELSGELVASGIFQRGGVRGFRVPGVGAVFQFNVNFPVAERKPAEKPEEPDKDDLWSRIERGESVPGVAMDPFGGAYGTFRVEGASGSSAGRSTRIITRRGRYGPYGGYGGGTVILSRDDRRKIEKLENIVLETLAGYGKRLTAIDDNEHIIILVGGGGKGGVPGVYSYMAADPMLPSGYSAKSKADDVVEIEVIPEPDVDRIEEQLRELQKQIDKVEERLRDLQEVPNDEKTKAVEQAHEDLKTALEQYKEQVRDRDRRTTRRRAATLPFTVKRGKETGHVVMSVTGGTAPATTWVLKVKKGDLVDDADDLRKVAEIHSN